MVYTFLRSSFRVAAAILCDFVAEIVLFWWNRCRIGRDSVRCVKLAEALQIGGFVKELKIAVRSS
jgi:hypothetical protein